MSQGKHETASHDSKEAGLELNIEKKQARVNASLTECKKNS
jgi:hypothetical protein